MSTSDANRAKYEYGLVPSSLRYCTAPSKVPPRIAQTPMLKGSPVNVKEFDGLQLKTNFGGVINP
jgi:hypothetical protein